MTIILSHLCPQIIVHTWPHYPQLFPLSNHFSQHKYFLVSSPPSCQVSLLPVFVVSRFIGFTVLSPDLLFEFHFETFTLSLANNTNNKEHILKVISTGIKCRVLCFTGRTFNNLVKIVRT